MFKLFPIGVFNRKSAYRLIKLSIDLGDFLHAFTVRN